MFGMPNRGGTANDFALDNSLSRAFLSPRAERTADTLVHDEPTFDAPSLHEPLRHANSAQDTLAVRAMNGEHLSQDTRAVRTPNDELPQDTPATSPRMVQHSRSTNYRDTRPNGEPSCRTPATHLLKGRILTGHSCDISRTAQLPPLAPSLAHIKHKNKKNLYMFNVCKRTKLARLSKRTKIC